MWVEMAKMEKGTKKLYFMVKKLVFFDLFLPEFAKFYYYCLVKSL
jgi:hypothetical protein